MSGITGIPVRPTFLVSRGTVERLPYGIAMHPSDWMVMRNNGRTPLFTRYTLGTHEAERDRRLRRAGEVA